MLVVETATGSGRFTAEPSYAVFRTRPGGVNEVYNVGRTIDSLLRVEGPLKISGRRCVYDSAMVLNSLIYPVQVSSYSLNGATGRW